MTADAAQHERLLAQQHRALDQLQEKHRLLLRALREMHAEDEFLMETMFRSSSMSSLTTSTPRAVSSTATDLSTWLAKRGLGRYLARVQHAMVQAEVPADETVSTLAAMSAAELSRFIAACDEAIAKEGTTAAWAFEAQQQEELELQGPSPAAHSADKSHETVMALHRAEEASVQ